MYAIGVLTMLLVLYVSNMYFFDALQCEGAFGDLVDMKDVRCPRCAEQGVET